MLPCFHCILAVKIYICFRKLCGVIKFCILGHFQLLFILFPISHSKTRKAWTQNWHYLLYNPKIKGQSIDAFFSSIKHSIYILNIYLLSFSRKCWKCSQPCWLHPCSQNIKYWLMHKKLKGWDVLLLKGSWLQFCQSKVESHKDCEFVWTLYIKAYSYLLFCLFNQVGRKW